MPVCITGATGFVGAHVTVAFLEAGFPVHAAVRSPDDAVKTAPLREAAERTGTALTFFRADLGEPGSFNAAADGCEAVVHVAAVVGAAVRQQVVGRAAVAAVVAGDSENGRQTKNTRRVHMRLHHAKRAAA